MNLQKNVVYSQSFDTFSKNKKKDALHNDRDDDQSSSEMVCYVKLEKLDEPSRKGKFTCSKCMAVFIYQKSFLKHINQRHKSSSPIVIDDKENRPILNKPNRLKRLYSFKLNAPKKLKVLKVKRKCKSSSQEISNLEVVAIQYSDIIFTCKFCNEKLNGELEFEKHYEQIHSIVKGNISCSHCPENLNTKEELFWHLRTYHYPLKEYKCSDCDVTTFSDLQLTEHINDAHEQTKNFPCSACDSNFTLEDDLIDHFENEHFKI